MEELFLQFIFIHDLHGVDDHMSVCAGGADFDADFITGFERQFGQKRETVFEFWFGALIDFHGGFLLAVDGDRERHI